MIYVKIFTLDTDGKNVPAGRLVYDGKNIKAEPADSSLLKTILAEPIYATKITGDDTKSLSAKDGKLFMEGLRYQYKSAYLRAAEPVEDVG
jgi:hypothetical protein